MILGLILIFIPNGRGRLAMRSYVRDVVAGLKEGADLAVEDPRVGGVMHDRADDDAHSEPLSRGDDPPYPPAARPMAKIAILSAARKGAL